MSTTRRFPGSKKDNSGRKYVGGGRRPDLRRIRQEEAQERNAAWRALTPKEQQAEINRRLGVGRGAVKQRAKLNVLIERMNNVQPTVAVNKKAKR